MSLQVWLPLNGNLQNKGLSNIEITNNNTTINNNGKIGKCYQFGTNKYLKLIDYANEFLTYDTFSLSVWFKCTAQNTVHTGSALISGGNWNDASNLLNLALGNFSGDHYTKILISGSGSWYNGYSYNFYLNTWYNVILTSGNGAMRVYVNGELIGDTYAAFTPTTLQQSWICIGNGTYSQGFHFIGLMNDVRIYNHCLSLKEVKEISKALALHYPLDDKYIESTTNLCNGLVAGGRTTVINNTIVNTGANADTYWCIKPKEALVGGATYTVSCYLTGFSSNSSYISWGVCAQSGANFAGSWKCYNGYNEFTFTMPSGLNGSTANMIFDDNGGTRTEIFTISQIQLEKKDHATGYTPFGTTRDENIIYDTSGYQNNGIINNITCSSNTPRYQISSQFTATNTSYIKVSQNNWMAQGATDITINIWAYMNDWSQWNGHRIFSCTQGGGWNIQSTIANSLTFPVDVYTNSAKTSTSYIPTASRVSILKTDISSGWHMFTYIYNTNGCKVYLDGQLYQSIDYTSYGIYYALGSSRLFLGCQANGINPSGPYFTGKQSDFRIYYTTLSDEDILQLYHTKVIADKNNNFYTFGKFNQIENNIPCIQKTAITNIYKLNEIVKNNLLLNTSIEKIGNSANAQWFRWNVEIPYLSSNISYTLSFDAKITNTSDVFYIGFANGDSTQEIIAREVIVTTNYKKYTFTKATTKTNINSIIISNARQYGRGNENNTGSILYVKNIKLELGDYSTPYIQAGNNISNIYYTRNGQLIDNQSIEI